MTQLLKIKGQGIDLNWQNFSMDRDNRSTCSKVVKGIENFYLFSHFGSLDYVEQKVAEILTGNSFIVIFFELLDQCIIEKNCAVAVIVFQFMTNMI